MGRELAASVSAGPSDTRVSSHAGRHPPWQHSHGGRVDLDDLPLQRKAGSHWGHCRGRPRGPGTQGRP